MSHYDTKKYRTDVFYQINTRPCLHALLFQSQLFGPYHESHRKFEQNILRTSVATISMLKKVDGRHDCQPNCNHRVGGEIGQVSSNSVKFERVNKSSGLPVGI